MYNFSLYGLKLLYYIIMYDVSDPFYMVMQKYNMKRGNTMIKAGIIGATGYAGAELVRILMNHKEVEIDGMAHEAMWMRIMPISMEICFR